MQRPRHRIETSEIPTGNVGKSAGNPRPTPGHANLIGSLAQHERAARSGSHCCDEADAVKVLRCERQPARAHPCHRISATTAIGATGQCPLSRCAPHPAPHQRRASGPASARRPARPLSLVLPARAAPRCARPRWRRRSAASTGRRSPHPARRERPARPDTPGPRCGSSRRTSSASTKRHRSQPFFSAL